MSVAASIFATRYVSAVGVTALIYDHGLTCKDEVNLIWTNPAAGPLSRLGFLVNRYLTEATAIYVAYMLSGGSHGLQNQSYPAFKSVNQVPVIVMSRVYVLWDRRRSIKWILMGAFGVAISITMIFAILAAHQVQAELEYDPDIHMCVFSKKPPGLPVMLGALHGHIETGLDLFIILMTIFNALDRPHEKQADVVTALQHDGARMFVVS
ncbi:hypothetical protein B0H11DRAFT_2217873 [Mycena galericulata]|nr:hypothetical protein B0H11DRAFT_2217873 [Mycena galericulata]